jgi:predicted acetyltransferase
MDELKLVKPTEEFLPQIRAFREAFKDCLDWLHGAHGLREIEDLTQWLRFSASFESEQTVPEGFSPYSQFLCLRVVDKKNCWYDRRSA